jgi:hypothetical protein
MPHALHGYARTLPSAYAGPEQLVLEFRNQATARPELFVVAINEAPGVFFCDLVPRAYQIDCRDHAAVHVLNIGSISCHLRLDFSGAASQTVCDKPGR